LVVAARTLISITLFALVPRTAPAQSATWNEIAEADTFVSSDDPSANYGIQGAMEIAAPTTAQPRTEETLLRFDMGALQASFDDEYGSGNWIVTDVSLSLFSNVSKAGQQPSNARFNKIAAGSFEFDLLSNNDWNENDITWDSLTAILPGQGNTNSLTSLSVFFWAADGSPAQTWTLSAADAMLLNQIYSGGKVTIFGQPTAGSSVGYLFNTLRDDPGYLNVTVVSVPEPFAVFLTPCFVAACLFHCSGRRPGYLTKKEPKG
jgi:hypothetical protein